MRLRLTANTVRRMATAEIATEVLRQADCVLFPHKSMRSNFDKRLCTGELVPAIGRTEFARLSLPGRLTSMAAGYHKSSGRTFLAQIEVYRQLMRLGVSTQGYT